jgi:hypothetical protein
MTNIDTKSQKVEPAVLAVGRFVLDDRSGQTIAIIEASRSAESAGERAMVLVMYKRTS